MPSKRMIVALMLTSTLAANARALEIVAGMTEVPLRAFQDITLFPGTPFNPTTENIFIPGVSGEGIFGLDRMEQVGDVIQADFFGGVFAGSHPALGSYVFGAVGGLSESIYTTQIADVVQDPSDPGFATGDPSSFVSGVYTLTGPQFGFEFLTGPAAGVVLLTDPTQDFGIESNFDGLPPSPGTLFTTTGDDFLNVLFNGQVIGTTSGRVLVTLPEPAAAMLGLAASILLSAVRVPSQVSLSPDVARKLGHDAE